MPSKIFEYLNLGLPILAAVPRGDASDLVQGEGFGESAPSSDLLTLAKKIERMNDRYYLNQCAAKVKEKRALFGLERLMDEGVVPLLQSLK